MNRRKFIRNAFAALAASRLARFVPKRIRTPLDEFAELIAQQDYRRVFSSLGVEDADTISTTARRLRKAKHVHETRGREW